MPDASRPVVTLDLDGVLCRPPFGLNPGRGRHKSRSGVGHRSALWLTERWRYVGRKPMTGAGDGFAALSGQFDCHVLTARSEVARGLTERWLRRHLGAVPRLHMRPTYWETPAQFKARMVQEVGALAHFEDDPQTAEWLAELLPAVFVVDWHRNRGLEGARIHRIHRLVEALPVLEALAARPSAQG